MPWTLAWFLFFQIRKSMLFSSYSHLHHFHLNEIVPDHTLWHKRKRNVNELSSFESWSSPKVCSLLIFLTLEIVPHCEPWPKEFFAVVTTGNLCQSSGREQRTAWCSEIGSLWSPDAPELHASVMSEYQFHCTRLYVHACLPHCIYPEMMLPHWCCPCLQLVDYLWGICCISGVTCWTDRKTSKIQAFRRVLIRSLPHTLWKSCWPPWCCTILEYGIRLPWAYVERWTSKLLLVC